MDVVHDCPETSETIDGSPDTYSYDELDPGKIRLIVLEPGSLTDLIGFTLLQDWLGQPTRQYEALSYTWGDATTTEFIICSQTGKRLCVTANCASALRRLRFPWERRWLWIDAICINQSDLRERERQVSSMGEIYRAAERVLVYLGEEADGSTEAMNYLRSIETMEQTWNSPLSPQLRAALRSLMRRPWFGRIWILQEVHNARSALVLCGPATVGWAALLLYKWWHSLGRRDFHTWPLVMSLKDQTRYSARDLLPLLTKARPCGATDARDRIYALLPMLQFWRSAGIPGPDYAISKEQAFIQVALFLYRQSLAFLTAVSHAPDEEDTDRPSARLPSWVPDWSYYDKCVPIWPDTGRSIAQSPVLSSGEEVYRGSFVPSVGPNQHGDVGLYQSGGPSGTFVAEIQQSNDGLPSLKVRGARVAKIRWVSRPTRTSVSELLRPDGRFRKAYFDLRQNHPLPPGHALIAVGHPLYSGLDAALRHGGLWQNLRSQDERDRLWRGEVVSLINGRRVFAADHGVLGMVPAAARTDDIICIILGAPIPFVVRPVADGAGYLLVGGCYVNGMMTAEAISYLKERAVEGLSPPVVEEDFVLV
jgi:hypothetical protein